jgi:hypothetical protein
MQSGYFLNYSDSTLGALFKRHNVDIHDSKYQNYGTSKAKKMRAFWEQESDSLVGKVLAEILDSYEADCAIENTEVDSVSLEKARGIASRLSSASVPLKSTYTDDDFLNTEFVFPDLRDLPIETAIIPIIEVRLNEARKAMSAGAYLSTILLCGSVLEAVLLGAAQKDPARFNRASASPKTSDGSVKRLHEWSLAQLIDVACEIDLLKHDIKKFSHGLRDFRNYIHPYEQMSSGFNPDNHTAKVCFQVLKAALASVTGSRN